MLPLPSPLVLLVLGANRTIPVRITEFSVVEEAFDTRLNPIRARVSLGLRALSTDDLAFGRKGAGCSWPPPGGARSWSRAAAPGRRRSG